MLDGFHVYINEKGTGGCRNLNSQSEEGTCTPAHAQEQDTGVSPEG